MKIVHGRGEPHEEWSDRCISQVLNVKATQALWLPQTDANSKKRCSSCKHRRKRAQAWQQ
jgi:hypothetical protein